MVVNVTWRNKSFIGTLLDSTKHDWAPPRFCESPTSDLESRGGNRNRNCKRSRGSISESENNIKLQQSKLRNGKGRRNFTVPSPVREQQSNNNNSNVKRSNNSKSDSNTTNKQQRSTPPLDSSVNNSTNNNSSPLASSSQSNQTKNQQSSPVLIECPEAGCNKKYKHINGLKYHQTHAHHDTNSSSKSANNNSGSLINTNKNDELSESNKDNEETDTEDFLDSEAITSLSVSNNKNKTQSSKAAKSSGSRQSSKANEEDRNSSNKSPAYSDISDDTESESRPSSNNSNNTNNVQNNQSINNSSAKNDEINRSSSSTASSILQSNGLDDVNGSLSTLPLLSQSSEKSSEDHNNSKLLSPLSRESQKTNEVDKKLTNDVAHQPQSATDKLLLLNSSNTAMPPSTTANASFLPNNTSTALAKTNNAQLPPNFPMDPALHAYLMQTDLNYRISYERYLIEHQEKLFASLIPNELSEIEKERHKSFLLAQNSAFTNLNGLNKESTFKLPVNSLPTASSNSPKLASVKTTDRPTSTTSSPISGGSIVNGTSNLSQQSNCNSNVNKSVPSPYDFMEFEKQLEKQSGEMFRLTNSFKIEEQRLLHSKTPMPNNNSNQPYNKKSTTTSTKEPANQLNGANKVIKADENIKTSIETIGPQTNFQIPFNFPTPPFLNQSSFNNQHLSISSFAPPSNATSVHHLPFDPSFFRGQSPLIHHQIGNVNSNSTLPQSAFNPLRFSNASLSPIDLNCSASKLFTASQQASAAQMLNNGKKTENLMYNEHGLISPKSAALGNGLSADKLTPNGLHRTLAANLSQNSSTMLNTSNNSNLSASIKKDENRSSPPSRHLNNAQHVGVGFPATFIDPYGGKFLLFLLMSKDTQ